jgi:hypothetical protein
MKLLSFQKPSARDQFHLPQPTMLHRSRAPWRRLIAILPAVLLITSWFALPLVSHAQSTTITAGSTLPVPYYGVSSFQVKYLNPFRYDYNQTAASTVIAAPTPPSQLLPSSGSGSSTPQAISSNKVAAAQPASGNVSSNFIELFRGNGLSAAKKAKKPAPQPPAPAPNANDCKISSPTSIWTTSPSNQSDRITYCWNRIQGDVQAQEQNALNLRHSINAAIRGASTEQACYADKVKHFSQTLLTDEQAKELLQFAQDERNKTSTSCRIQGDNKWDFNTADTIDTAITQDQADLANLASAQGYSAWLGAKGSPNDTSNTALSASITSIQTDVRSYDLGTAGQGTNPTITQTNSAFQAVVAANQQWRDRIDAIASQLSVDDPHSRFIAIYTPNSCHDWYGKGHTETSTLKIVDVSVSSSSVPDLQVATNTCNPRSILSTGVGVSFLPNQTYAFVPNAAGTQVIGKTSSSKASPLFSIFYNILLTPVGKKDSGVELFLSPGIGLTSASSTTTSDYLGGLSLAFNRRLVFITAAGDFGQRTTLLPGFPLGTPMGTMSTVPTQTSMKFSGMLSISFGVAP